MGLSSDLISQFVKVTNIDKKTSKESTVYGTTVEYNGSKYVKLDGSELLTPVSTTSDTKAGERVTVMIKDHTATITGNISSPAARTEDVQENHDKIAEFDNIMAYKVTAENIEAVNATIENLKVKVASYSSMTAVVADIETLQSKFASLDKVNAQDVDALNAEIENIKSKFGEFTEISTEDLEAMNADIATLKSYTASFTYVSAERLTAALADIKELDAKKLSAEDAALKYANIDFSNIGKAAIEQFYATSGIIKDLVVGDTSVTGKLVGVTIVGDLIEGGTVKADKLVILGDDGLYYKLNTNGVTTSAEQTEYNSLNGSIITANTITAEKINVDDLVAFDATIGGFNITESAIYSGAKSSADNTTRGIYLDKEGQLVAGDDSNFLKYYKDTDGNYKLAISAESFIFSSTGEKIEDTIDSSAKDLQDLITEQNKSIIDSCNNNIDKALENYVRNGDYTQYKESVKAQLEILANQIEMNFTSVTNSIDTVNTNSQNKFNEISKYIRFTVDGIELGVNENTLKLTLDNDMIRFERNNETVGWWDGIDFHTGNIFVDVSEQAKFGNFAFVPRSDGSLMFLKVDSVIGGNLFSLSNCSYEENVDHYTAIGSTGATVYTSSTSSASVYFSLDSIKTYRITYTSDNAGLSGYTSGGSLNFAREQNGRQLITVTGATKFYFYAIDTTKDNYTFRDVKIVEVV